MDTLSADFAVLTSGGVFLHAILRGTRAGNAILFITGLLFFASPVWLPLLHPDLRPAVIRTPETPFLLKIAPAAVFLATLAITQAGVYTKKAVPAVVALVTTLVLAKSLSAPWSGAGDLAVAARFITSFGLSYFILRAIATVVDASRGTLKDIKVGEICSYLAFSPILSLGPLERAGSFVRELRKNPGLREKLADVGSGLLYMGEGLFKTLILGAFVYKFAAPVANGMALQLTGTAGGVAGPLAALFAYSIYLYVNFSGATDFAVGAARCFSIRIQGNFDLPYARPNIAEFWRSWHMSLSTWLRDYLFFPIAKRLPRDAAPLIAPLLVMSICGVWHGFTLPFLVWGLLHGAALAVHQLWIRARRASGALDSLCSTVVARAAGAVVTTLFVTFTWIFFSAPDLPTAWNNARLIINVAAGSPRAIGVAAAAVAIYSFIPAIRDAMRNNAKAGGTTVLAWMSSTWRTHAAIVCIAVVLARLFLARTPPEGGFVYANF